MASLGVQMMEAGVAPKLSHLQLLEAESIHIFREVAAEFEKPVMLYSIGKDSSVMLRLAQKAFYPGPIPFPLLHIDTGYKFKEMLAFRDDYTRQLGVELLLVWRNEEALVAGANPVALNAAADYLPRPRRCSMACAPMASTPCLRRSAPAMKKKKSRAKERIFSFRDGAGQWDPGRTSGPNHGTSITGAGEPRRKHSRIPLVELDRARRMALHSLGKDSVVPPLLCPGAPDACARRQPDPRGAGSFSRPAWGRTVGQVPPAFVGVQSVHWSHPLRCRHDSQDHCRAGCVSFF